MTSIKQAGATLLEMILVLVIMSSFLGMSYRFYNLYTYEQNVSLIKEQVGLIFDAMRLFYQANCNVYNASNWFAQSSTTTLIVLQGGYNALTPYLSNPIPINRLLNVTDSNFWYGYMAQFSLNTGNFVLPTSTNPPYGGNGTISIGTVLAWTAHVAIEPAHQSQVTALYNELGANCGSNFLNAANGVESCLDAAGVYGPPSCSFSCNFMGNPTTCTAAPPVQSGSTYSCPAGECAGFCAPFCCTGVDGQLNQTVIFPPR